MLELDHAFGIVNDPDDAAARLEADGWVLDAGQAHPGQGTRNRRLRWGGVFFELVWVADETEASRNVPRLDRRAAAAASGASPFGIALRSTLGPQLRGQYWLYDELGPRIWIHRDNEEEPERPMDLVLETVSRHMDKLGGSSALVGHQLNPSATCAKSASKDPPCHRCPTSPHRP